MQTAETDLEPGGSTAATLEYQPHSTALRLRSGPALSCGISGIILWTLIPLDIILQYNVTKMGPVALAVSPFRYLLNFGAPVALSAVAGSIVTKIFARQNRYITFAAITFALFLLIEMTAAQTNTPYLADTLYLLAIPLVGLGGVIAGAYELFSKRFRKSHAIAGLCLSLLTLALCVLAFLMIGMVLDGMDGHPWQL
jgi:hypothetical protein